MKKNISINISGIIFHIEEDGYEMLKKYLDSINRYFSSFEDNAEILADIESRIAEIFLSKLNEGKQVITSEDVQALITTMGSVKDFQAAEQADENSEKSQESSYQEQSYTGETSGYSPPKRLHRDQKRKILGGVCAGLAHYANIDPVWIRLLFALFTAAWGITLIIYIILWIAVPGSYDLEEPATKKMFRDPQKKVLSGVSAGIAAYFGIDVVVVRVLFIVFTFFGGIGFLIYVVLWIILPEAVTLTDRMKMQGEPVTLSNIESNIKKGLDIKEGDGESPLLKVLLFPFRLLAIIISGLGKILGPIVDVLRVAIGVVLTLLGLSLIFAVVVTIGITLGLFTFPWPWLMQHTELSFPLETIKNLIPAWMIIAAFFTALIPCLLVILSGISVINKRAIVNAPLGWTLFVLFFASVIVLAFGIPQVAYSFKEEGSYKTEQTFDLKGHTAILRVNEIGMDDYDGVDLTLRGYHGKDFKLEESYQAQGSTRQNAIENAQMIEYYVEQQDDSVLVFDSNIQFKDDAVFRAQRLDLTLYIPYHHPFVMEEAMSRFINQYVNYQYLDGYTWQMTAQGLECMDCPAEQKETVIPSEESDLTNFKGIEISGKFDLEIQRGDNYNVEFNGPDEEKNKYKVYRSDETLVIDYEGKGSINFMFKDLDADEMHITIVMPSLEKLEAVGYGTIRFEGVASANDLQIDLQGPVKVRGEMNTQNVGINLVGNSKADLRGTANTMHADAKFASELNAYDLQVTDATVTVNGASSAEVTVTGTLEMEKGIASKISYRGSPREVKEN